MNCPVCDAKLREVTKMNVQVDICPDCKGIWLDRGELEKIMEIAVQEGASEPTTYRPEPRREDYREEHREERKEYREHNKHDDHGYNEHSKDIDPRTGRRRKKESFLENIFDMFGGD